MIILQTSKNKTKELKTSHRKYPVCFSRHQFLGGVTFSICFCVFLDTLVMYLLFPAVCKIQMSFSVNANSQRSCSSALNAMRTTRRTSGNAPKCREESDISDRTAQPDGSFFTRVTGRKSLCSCCMKGSLLDQHLDKVSYFHEL